jgi:geranylgeranyl pyrophosphate synthase/predicted secreted hydrolase
VPLLAAEVTGRPVAHHDIKWHGSRRDQAPRPGYGSEWWSFHCDLTAATGEKYGLFCAFARHEATAPEGERLVTHSLRWAHVDAEDGFCVSESWLDSVELLRRATEADHAMDPYVRAALVEALSRGEPIGPDQLLPRPVRAGAEGLDLDYGGVGTLRATPEGSYEVVVDGENARFALTFTPAKPPLPQGEDGADGADGLLVHAVPRLAVRGTLEPLGAAPVEVSGTGWHEHVVGDGWHRLEEHRDPDRAWDWLRIQLTNGWELSAMLLRRAGAAQRCLSLVSAPDGRRVPASVTVRTGEPWTSLETLHTYATRFELAARELDLHLTLRLRAPLAEVPSLVPGDQALAPGATVEGVLGGEPVQGTAFVDALPFNRIDDLQSYPQRLDPMVRKEIASFYPDTLSGDSAARIFGMDDSDLDGIPLERLQQALIAPIRYVADSGGKRWRAFFCHTVVRTRGGRGRDVLPQLAAIEMVQSATLIIDDIEDASPQRRGQPAAHLVFGTPQAINAAIALFFTWDRFAATVEEVDERARLHACEAYMHVARVATLGQALDIAGHSEAMDAAVKTGDPGELLRAIRTTYRLKTAYVFRYITELGMRILDYDDPDIDAIRTYSEAVGRAVQITDDLLDLLGVSGRHRPTKRACEDLSAGKVTLPLAHAVRLLPREDIQALWKSVRGGGADAATVRQAAETLRDCGAVEACYAEAKTLVESAWPLLEEIPSTRHKVLLRAIGLYLASRAAYGDVS